MTFSVWLGCVSEKRGIFAMEAFLQALTTSLDSPPKVPSRLASLEPRKSTTFRTGKRLMRVTRTISLPCSGWRTSKPCYKPTPRRGLPSPSSGRPWRTGESRPGTIDVVDDTLVEDTYIYGSL